MLEKLKGKEFEYKKLTEAEQKSRGILGRLIGPCADFITPTRNGRSYPEKLWENVFENPIMKEKIANRCAFGELGHPENRAEVDIEKVALCLAEQPKKGSDGKLYGVFDILNTPNGKILKALCDYGCKIGISSRGQGDVDDFDNSVDPNTYECEGFDAVLVPGVEAARLKYVTEDYKKKSNLKTILAESLKAAKNESERKIMVETLKTLNLNEAVEQEVKLSDCTQVTTAAQAAELTKKLKAEWCFALEDSLGINVSEKYFDMLAKSMNLYILEKGEDSICFGVKKDGSIYGPYDIKDKKIDVNILVAVPTNPETSVEKVEETLLEEKAEKEETDEFAFDDLSDADLETVEDNKSESEEDEAEESEEDEAPEVDEEQIFLDFLANNFEEEKVRKVCKLLDIEIDGDETPEEKAEEESVENDSNMGKTPEENIDVEEEETDKLDEPVKEAIDNGTKTLVTNLKETLKIKSDLENNVKSLQEKLAVSDAQVNEIKEECNKYKQAVARLSLLAKSSKDLKEKNSELEESLKQKTAVIKTQKERITRLAESSGVNNEKTKLTEEVNAKATEIKKLNEAFTIKQAEYETKITALNNQLNESKVKNQDEVKSLTENATKMNNLKESYRKLANKAVNKYIEVKSETLGLTSVDIKRKLGESYTLEDVDQICEDLKRYQLNVSKLPFSLDRKVGVRVNESKTNNALNVNKTAKSTDDDVDESLIKLANFTH